MTNSNSGNSTKKSVDPKLRKLILDYIAAFNSDQYSLAEEYLFQIRQIKEQKAKEYPDYYYKDNK